MNQDELKPIADLPNYFVSADARVWHMPPDQDGILRGMSQYRRPYGARYCVVSLRADGGKGKVVCRYVHLLVLTAFRGPCPEWAEECRHYDGDTSNNKIGNLLWGTKKQNADDRRRHGTQVLGSQSKSAKITESDVVSIRRRLDEGEPQRLIGELFGITQSTVSMISSRKIWRHVV